MTAEPIASGIAGRPGILKRIRATMATGLVLCGLAGTAWWGHHTDWTFGWNVQEADGEPHSNSERCTAHGWLRGECAACRLGREVVQFRSVQEFDRSGVELDVVGRGEVAETIAAAGETSFDPVRTAHLTSRAKGTITRVLRRLGETVAAGDVLVLVDALEVGQAKSELLKALSDLRLKRRLVERLTPLAATGAAPARQLIEAEAAQQGAEIHLLAAEETLANLGLRVRGAQFAELPIPKILEELRFFGIPEQQITAQDRAEGSSNLIPVRTPIAGVVVASDAVVGEVVGPATELFTVADRSRLWVTLEVRQSDLSRVTRGQPLLFRPDGAELEVAGQVEWIADTIDEGTRTLDVRGEVANDALRIKAGAFGSGRLVVRETPDALVVPRTAVHRQGGRAYVFVRHPEFLERKDARYFEPRLVRLGVEQEETNEVIDGLTADEVIATRGSERWPSAAGLTSKEADRPADSPSSRTTH